MRVLHIIGDLGTGGAEKLLNDSLPLLKEKGHYVEVVILQQKKEIYKKSIEAAGIKVISLSEDKIYSLKNIIKLRRFFKKNKFDIINVHLFPELYFTPISLLGLKGKQKLIFTEHSSNNRRRDKKFQKIEKIIYSFYDKIICISKTTEKNLRKHLQDYTKNILTIENGIDLNKIAEAEPLNRLELNLKNEDCIITMVGSFTPAKDQETLIRAMQFLPKKYKLLLVGNGPKFDEVNEIVKKLNLENRIKLLGNRKDIYRIYKMSNLVVLSSFFEGMPLSLMEGMACNKVCFGSRVPGIVDLIDDDRVLFERGNAKELSEKIANIEGDKTLKSLLKEKNKKKINEFSIEKMLNRYLDEYLKLIGEKND
ncbi:glycosyltransferase [Cetobacterium sp.]|uniref:glycosyltransferase n=1 Tax=Cetobacterium sp. TaxID=2071632 RepID=UPI003EE7A81D